MSTTARVVDEPPRGARPTIAPAEPAPAPSVSLPSGRRGDAATPPARDAVHLLPHTPHPYARRRRLVGAVAFGVAAGILTLAAYRAAQRAVPAAAPTAAARPTVRTAGRAAAVGVAEAVGVAVAPAGGDAGPQGAAAAAVAAVAAEQLARAGIVRVVEVAPAAGGAAVTPDDRAAAFRRAALAAGAPVVVTLTVLPLGDSLRVTARVVDARSGAVRGATAPVVVSARTPTAGLEPLRQRLLAAVAAAVDPDLRVWAKATPPSSYDAYRLGRDGTTRALRGDYRGALAPFLRANQLDTTYSLALVNAVMTSVNLGEWPRADSLIGVLDRRRAILTPAEHRMLAWLQARLRGDRLAAYALARGTGDLFPGTYADIQEGVEAVVVNRPADAIRVLARIDPARPDVRGWAPYWLRLTEARHLVGDHAGELAAARRAREVVGADRLWTVELEARALAAVGRTGELAALLDRALAMPAEGGRTPGEVLVATAAELRAHGRPDEAGPVVHRALAWFAAHPAAPGARAPGLRARAEALLLAGRPADARRRLLAWPADSTAAWYGGLLGVAAARAGDRAAARRAAAALARDPRPYQFGRTLYWAGAVRAALGDSAAAVAALREAFARGQPYGAYLHAAPEWEALHGYAPFEQLIRPAR